MGRKFDLVIPAVQLLVNQAMADKAFNNSASDGWSVMQVDWDDELNRAAIVF